MPVEIVSRRRLSNSIAFDDAPFGRNQKGRVRVVGTVYACLRFDGLVIGAIEKDGSDATTELARLVAGTKFAQHVQLILLQGITMAGFNVVDIHELHRQTGVPVLVVARKPPDLNRIRSALLTKITGGADKWAKIEKSGEMEPVGDVVVQRVGLTPSSAKDVITRLTITGSIPEPIRVAHLIAGALTYGMSHGRV
jgi:endonuclease V-like protein UPF0215 family